MDLLNKLNLMNAILDPTGEIRAAVDHGKKVEERLNGIARKNRKHLYFRILGGADKKLIRSMDRKGGWSKIPKHSKVNAFRLEGLRMLICEDGQRKRARLTYLGQQMHWTLQDSFTRLLHYMEILEAEQKK